MKARDAVDVADRLGHRLGHVGAGMEEELHQGDALDVLRLDVVDAVDVEEVILVVVGDQPFHLGGVHAAVGLGDVDDRQVELREDVDLHPRRRPGRCPGRRRATATITVIGMPQGEDDRVQVHADNTSGRSLGNRPFGRTTRSAGLKYPLYRRRFGTALLLLRSCSMAGYTLNIPCLTFGESV